ncbi:putative ribosome biogenesis protein slx9-like [Impatiens glandulifera]|uniref:putative ribosome biogenesis protein slx9-like n=1 Tax=Impatiens glandulifera TaxID=253017 RepID=UPI001FB1408F|nr:putative ribosome biogenesis protein slx9-like [Impatiens glandulifera]
MGKTRSRPEESSTRAEKKFDKKLQFYTNVRDTVASLSVRKDSGAQKSISKKTKRRKNKLKAYDLSTLIECLPELKTSTPKLQAAPKLLNCRARQQLVLKETVRLNSILNDPSYQANPLASIHEHLLSTQPAEEKPERKKGSSNDKKKNKKKKRSKAISSKPQLMEF